MSDTIDAANKEKKAYSKPELVRYPLRPEEAVLGACKSTTLAGPASSPCASLGCSTNGS